MLRTVVPITLALALLDWLGALTWIFSILTPVMAFVGLPGRASLVFVLSALLNLYSAIAVAVSMSLDMRSATILAIMCLIAHNLVAETRAMKRTGSSSVKMVFLRVGIAFVAAYAFNLLLPAYLLPVPSSSAGAARSNFLGMLAAWGISTAAIALRFALIVLGASVVNCLLDEFNAMTFLARLFMPVMSFFGLPREASSLWIAINIAGYAYGAGIVQERIKSGDMKPQEADLFNHHAALCHSLMEDSVLFLVVGIPLFWITVPRLILALLAVWIERVRRRFFRRSFRVGTV
jgi:hypothetical protein